MRFLLMRRMVNGLLSSDVEEEGVMFELWESTCIFFKKLMDVVKNKGCDCSTQ